MTITGGFRSWEGTGRITALRSIRAHTGCSLKESMAYLAVCFGFYDSPLEPPDFISRSGWSKFVKFQDQRGFSLEAVQGPHAMTMLKAIAAKYKDTSTGQ